jgi:hypothetical protein
MLTKIILTISKYDSEYIIKQLADKHRVSLEKGNGNLLSGEIDFIIYGNFLIMSKLQKELDALKSKFHKLYYIEVTN